MNTPSLTYYARLNNLLKATPRSKIHEVCRGFGFQSWHCNAKQSPNYTKYSQSGVS